VVLCSFLVAWPVAVARADTSANVPLTKDGCREDVESIRQTDEFFTKAGAAYQAQDLEQAILWMSRAHEASSCHDFLIVLGQLNEKDEAPCTALEWYRHYLRSAPAGHNAEHAHERIAVLDVTCPPTPPSTLPASTPPPNPTPPSPSVPPVPATPAPSEPAQTRVKPAPSLVSPEAPYFTPTRAIGWSAVGGGVVAGVAALYLATVAADANDEYERRWRNQDDWKAKRDSLQSKGESAERSAQILGVTAGALAATGAALLLFGDRLESRPERSHLSLAVTPKGSLAEYLFRF
jgi:hypothetical protein